MNKELEPKSGGNGTVKFEGNCATKTLHKKIKGEYYKKIDLERFKREIEALKVCEVLNIENVVKIYDYSIEDKIWYKMERCDGDLNDLLEETKGNIQLTTELLLPLIKTLKQLSELEEPIYHRDIKPQNILYKKINGKYKLYLADFGCCWLKNSSNEERLTLNHISVGARNYMAPEYQYGKVETIDEKGDIFSIGKLLWYLINGEKFIVFPYTLWYVDIYNIKNRCTDKRISQLNSVIAGACHHNKNKRINYSNMIKNLENIIDNKIIDNSNILNLLEYETQLNLKNEAIAANFSNLYDMVVNDFTNCINYFLKKYPDVGLIKEFANGFNTLMADHCCWNAKELCIEKIKNNETFNCPIDGYILNRPDIKLKIYPQNYKNIELPKSVKKDTYGFIFEINPSFLNPQFEWFTRNGVVIQNISSDLLSIKDKEVHYNKSNLINFLEENFYQIISNY